MKRENVVIDHFRTIEAFSKFLFQLVTFRLESIFFYGACDGTSGQCAKDIVKWLLRKFVTCMLNVTSDTKCAEKLDKSSVKVVIYFHNCCPCMHQYGLM